jgi:hypothetical protein
MLFLWVTPSWFLFFGFRNNKSLTEQGRQPYVQHPIWRTRSQYLYPVIPQPPGSLFVSFYDSQGYGGGIIPASKPKVMESTRNYCAHLRVVSAVKM